MLPKINALKQYFPTQAGTYFTSACVAVMWRIPPPNSSPTFEVSAIFCPVKIYDIFVCAVDAKWVGLSPGGGVDGTHFP